MMEVKDIGPYMLKKERQTGDVNVSELTNLLQGGEKRNARRKEFLSMLKKHPVLSDRDMMFRNHTERYNTGLKKSYHYVKLLSDENITDKDDKQLLYSLIGEPLPIDVHRAMFTPTLENQADDEQQKKWLPLAYNYNILGAYAQTELGHGSNVQGIETTATYDKKTQEFEINSPTLTSRKWWPGGLGKTDNYAIVHARLYIDGKDHGVQAFLVQLRSLKDHQPLPGIEVGDIGPKVGFNPIDNGYCSFDHVRIPRDQMMMRYAKVLPDGTFVKPKSSKLVYLTMVAVRSGLISGFARSMSMATTITTRFSAARIQGRKPNGEKGEFQVLDYQNQQFALFPLIGLSYAALFAGDSLQTMHDNALEVITSGKGEFEGMLAELHAVSSGLKAWTAMTVSNGVESCRRMCGGHGYLQSSGLPHIFNEGVGANTFEGTFDVLVQQHARYLIKVLSKKEFDTQSGTVRFLADADKHSKLNMRFPAQKAEDFTNLQRLVEAFEVAASRSVVHLAQQVKAANGDMQSCMVLMTVASIAHTQLMLLKSFVEGLQKVPEGSTRNAVASLANLFGLWMMTQRMDEFRAHDYVSTAQAEMARAQLMKLLPVVRKNVVLLTDAWDYDDFELNSALGNYDGDIYNALVKRAADEPLNRTQVVEGYENYLKPLIQSNM